MLLIDFLSRIVSILFLTFFLSIQANSLSTRDFGYLLFIGTLISVAPLLDLGSQSTFQRYLSSIRTENEKPDLLSSGLGYLGANARTLVSQSLFSSAMVVVILNLLFNSLIPFTLQMSVYVFPILMTNFSLSLLLRFFQIISKSSWYYSIQALCTLIVIIQILLSQTQTLDLTFFLQKLLLLYIFHALASLSCLMKFSHKKLEVLELPRVSWRESVDLKIQLTQSLFLLSFVLLNAAHFERNNLELNTAEFQFYQRIYNLIVVFSISYLIGISFARTTSMYGVKSLLGKGLIFAMLPFLLCYGLGQLGILASFGFPSLNFWSACVWSVLVTIQIYNSWFVIMSFNSRKHLVPFLGALVQCSFVLSVWHFDELRMSSFQVLFSSQLIFFITIQLTRNHFK